MNLVEQAIAEHWGEKCDDYEQGCPVCDAWRQYDNLVTYGTSEPKEEEVISNAPPLSIEVRMAINKLIVEGKIHDVDNKTK